jgi:WD40 repeat protein
MIPVTDPPTMLLRKSTLAIMLISAAGTIYASIFILGGIFADSIDELAMGYIYPLFKTVVEILRSVSAISLGVLLASPAFFLRRGARGSWYALSLLVAAGATTGAAVAQSPEARPPEQALPELTLVQELKRPHTTTSVRWSSDGSKLAAYTVSPTGSISGNLVTIWSADGKVFREIAHPDSFFFGNDPLTFVASDKEIVTTPWLKSNALAFLVFDIETGLVVREIEGPEPNRGRPDNAASAFAVSPDESMLAVVFGTLRSLPVGLYSTRDWDKLADLSEGSSRMPRRLAFSRDGKLLAIAYLGEHKVVIYDIASKQPMQTIDAFSDGAVETMAFSSDGGLLAVGTASLPHFRGADAINDPVRVFRVTDGSRVASYEQPLSPIFSLAWSPDRHSLAFITGFDHAKLHLWNPFEEKISERIIRLTGAATSLAFSPDGKRLAVAHGNSVAIYHLTY